MRFLSTLLACGCILGGASAARGIVMGQVDDFQDGTTMGWLEGAPSPNSPVVAFDEGPGGVGDHSLRNISDGGGGSPGGAMAMFNVSQWTGDYLAAGVDSITAWMRAGANGAPLLMRIALQGAPGQQYASTVAAPLPADDAWHNVTFGLTAGDLTQVLGADPLNAALANVTQLRILSATAPAWRGERIAAILDVDNVKALPEPTGLSIVAVGILTLISRRRSRRA